MNPTTALQQNTWKERDFQHSFFFKRQKKSRFSNEEREVGVITFRRRKPVLGRRKNGPKWTIELVRVKELDEISFKWLHLVKNENDIPLRNSSNGYIWFEYPGSENINDQDLIIKTHLRRRYVLRRRRRRLLDWRKSRESTLKGRKGETFSHICVFLHR